jgi:hypothetical protein
MNGLISSVLRPCSAGNVQGGQTPEMIEAVEILKDQLYGRTFGRLRLHAIEAMEPI